MSAPTDRSGPHFASRRALPGNLGRTCVVFALAAALHVLPWLLWSPTAAPQVELSPSVRVSVLRFETAPRNEFGPPRPDSPTRLVPRRAQRPVLEPPPPAAAAETEGAAHPRYPAADTPPASASSAPATPLDLDSPSIRRAIREAARGPSAADLGDVAPGIDRKFGESIASGARGDCLKGEFAGGGMGLLSLPFLAIATLRDQCGK